MSPTRPRRDDALRRSALVRELADLSSVTDGILRTLGTAVVAVDGYHLIVYVNPAAESLFGVPASRLLGQPAGEVVRTRSGGDLLAALGDEAETWGEVDLLTPDGRTVHVDARITRRPEGDGAVAVFADLTETRRIQDQLRRKEQMAALGELSAGVAHEIRNPLAGIAGGAQLLRSRLGEGHAQAKIVNVILDETRRLERIVESLLEYARPHTPRLRQADVGDCLNRALQLVEDRAREAGVAVERAVADALPAAWIDPDQMIQVYLNLLQNAVQAQEGGGRISVSADRVTHPRHVRRSGGRRREDAAAPPRAAVPLTDWIEVRIHDDGPGMSEETVARAFDPFFTTRRQGTGLGLAICQTIVQEHAGRILLESAPGAGTTVLVDLPVEKRAGRRRRN